MRALLVVAVLVGGCGAAGRPRPDAPTPEAPSLVWRRAPDGWEVESTPSGRVETGVPGPSVHLFVDPPGARGQPLYVVLAEQALRLRPLDASQRLVGVVSGPPGAPTVFPVPVPRWTPPPTGPDEPPLAFRVDAHVVELAFGPPPADTTEVELLRDGAPVARVPADRAVHVDTEAPSGGALYSVRWRGLDYVTAASPTVAVEAAATVTSP